MGYDNGAGNHSLFLSILYTSRNDKDGSVRKIRTRDTDDVVTQTREETRKYSREKVKTDFPFEFPIGWRLSEKRETWIIIMRKSAKNKFISFRHCHRIPVKSNLSSNTSKIQFKIQRRWRQDEGKMDKRYRSLRKRWKLIGLQTVLIIYLDVTDF